MGISITTVVTRGNGAVDGRLIRTGCVYGQPRRLPSAFRLYCWDSYPVVIVMLVAECRETVGTVPL